MRRYIKMKKTISQDKKRNYAKRFFKEAEVPARFGKTTHISSEDHQKIQAIVRVIGKGEVSLYSYLDNVIADHLERHRAEIEELYSEHISPIF